MSKPRPGIEVKSKPDQQASTGMDMNIISGPKLSTIQVKLPLNIYFIMPSADRSLLVHQGNFQPLVLVDCCP